MTETTNALKGNPAFEIARRDAKITRLMAALGAIHRGDVSPMRGASDALSFEDAMDKDYERG